MIKAIETQYKGYRFRSRLEARWAVFFDALGIEWEYEPEGYDLGEAGWYLPDFWLPKCQWHFEVKGQKKISSEESAKIRAFDNCPPEKSMGVITLVGPPRFWNGENGLEWWECNDLGGYLASRLETSREQYNHAVAVALSARFEHGESPQ